VRNSISTTALSEFVNEVRSEPAEGVLSYGIKIDWESGTRSKIEAKTMTVGPHRVSRAFSWKADEPRQLLGTNHAANPQELLLSGLGSCMMVSFLAGASAMGIQIETLEIEFDGTLDLRGFMGIESNSPVGFPDIRYQIRVTGDATAEKFEELHQTSVAHSPNAQSFLNPVALKGTLFSKMVLSDEL